jgi:hypothetical protein
MVEYIRIAVLVHSVQEGTEVLHACCERLECVRRGGEVPPVRRFEGVQHDRDDGCARGFDSDGDGVEPGFVKGAGEGVLGGDDVEVAEGGVRGRGLEVPEVEGGVGRDRGEAKGGGDGEEGEGEGRWEDLIRGC